MYSFRSRLSACSKIRSLSISLVVFLSLFILSTFLFTQTASAVTFEKTIGGAGNDWGSTILQTPDGGYIFQGYSESFGGPGKDLHLVKTDSSGIEQWSNTYGGSYTYQAGTWGSSLAMTSDGGYIVFGTTTYTGAGGSDMYLVKTDSNGTEQWSKAYGGGGHEMGAEAIQTSDGGYLLSGYTYSYGAGLNDMYLIKTDSSGNELWSRTFGTSNYNHGFSILETSDGGYVFLGDNKVGGYYDMYLVKVDSNGVDMWSNDIGGAFHDRGYSIEQDSDGGLLLFGLTSSFGAGGFDMRLVKTDSNGVEQWSKTYGGISDELAWSVKKTQDGGNILLGYTGPYEAGEDDVYLVKTDSSGNEQWSKTYGGSGEDRGFSVIQTIDGGYAIIGHTTSTGAGGRDMYLIKTDASGNINPAQSDKIVFSYFHPTELPNSEIIISNPDGSDAVQLTNDSYVDISPYLSPDGTRIAYTSYRSGFIPEIFTMNSDGTNVQQLTTSTYGSYFGNWSPDGSKMIFARAHQPNRENANIYIMDSDGNNVVRITNQTGVNQGQPGFFPSGDKIYFSSGAQYCTACGEIYTLDYPSLSNLTRLTTNGINTPYLDFGATQFVAQDYIAPGNGNIVTLNNDGSNLYTVINNGGNNKTQGWLPDSSKLIYSTHGGNSDYTIHTINPDGTNDVIIYPYQDPLEKGLIAYYPFEGDATDATGNGHDGTEHNGVTYSTGALGQAASFDGANDYVNVPHDTALDLPNIGTVSAWFKMTHKNGDPNNAIVGKYRSDTTEDGYIIYADQTANYDQVRIFAKDNNNNTSKPPYLTDYVLGEWMHAVLVYEGNYVKSYINGQYYGSGAVISPSPGNPRPLLVGAGMNNYNQIYNFFSGNIDEVRIYDRALSGAEIKDLFDMAQLNTPPVADAGTYSDKIQGELVTLDGSASSDPDNDPITYLWTLTAPAGSTAALSSTTTVNPTFTPDLVGQYEVSLVVNDGELDSAADVVLINVNANLPPIVSVTGTPISGTVPLTVDFDASLSTDPELGVLTYSWDFGDATATETGATPSHTYTTVGIHTAIVTVTDDYGNSEQGSVEITAILPNMPPTVGPVATPSSGYSPLEVQLTANATDPNPADVLTYSWNFGDGTPGSTDANPLHTYNLPGTYNAEVTVSDGEFSVVDVVTICVDSTLIIDVREAKVDYGKKGKAKGKISFKASFEYTGIPDPTDLIMIEFDGISLLTVPFSYFELDDDDDGEIEYKYKVKNLKVKIDFTEMKIKISKHKMILTNLPDNSNGIDVIVSFGPSTGNDHFVMKSHGDDDDDDDHHGDDDHGDDDHCDHHHKKKRKLSYKNKHDDDHPPEPGTPTSTVPPTGGGGTVPPGGF